MVTVFMITPRMFMLFVPMMLITMLMLMTMILVVIVAVVVANRIRIMMIAIFDDHYGNC